MKKRWTPLVTAVLAVLGLTAFVLTNTAGGLVVAQEQEEAAGEDPPATSIEAPATTEPSTPAEPTSTSPEPQQVPGFPDEVAYAGNADRGGLAVAVAVKGDEAAAYLCDGARVESWMTGTARDGRISVRSKDGTSELTGELSGERLSGTGVARGAEFEFDLPAADPPAGLYKREDGDTTTGWIVLQDGRQIGVSTAGGESAPAPELDIEDGSADRVEGDMG